jgi:hypothetical protein
MDDYTVKTKIHRTVSTLLALLLMLVSAAAPPTTATIPIAAPMEIAPPGEVPDVPDMDITQLQINPQHTRMDLMPGESDKITVTVKTRTTRPYDGAVRTWKLKILPHYVEEFDYTITIGDAT